VMTIDAAIDLSGGSWAFEPALICPV
jgi:hypothetical protein